MRRLALILVLISLLSGCGGKTTATSVNTSNHGLQGEFVVNGIRLGDSKDTLTKKLGLPHYKDDIAPPFIRYSYGQVCYFLVNDKVEAMISADFEQKTKRGVRLNNLVAFNKTYSEFKIQSINSNYRFVNDETTFLAANNYGRWLALVNLKYIKEFDNSYFDIKWQ